MGNRFKLKDGRIVDVPEEELEAFAAAADKRGEDFATPIDEPDDVPAGDTLPTTRGAVPKVDAVIAQTRDVPEPDDELPEGEMVVGPIEVIRSDTPKDSAIAALAARAEQPKEEPSWLGKAGAAVTGALRGATFGATDFVPGGKAFNAEQREKAPAYFEGGDVVGSIASPVNFLPGGVGARMAVGAGSAALRSYADGGTPADMGVAATADAALTGGLGLVGKAAKGIAGGLGNTATKARGAAYGVTEDLISDQMSRMGKGATADDALRQLVAEGERIAPPNRLIPQGPGTYAQKFSGEAKRINTGIDDELRAAQRAGAQLPANPRGQVARQLVQQADDAAGGGFRADEAPALRQAAENVANGPQMADPLAVRAQKQGFDAKAYKGVAAGSPESLQGQANKAAADEYRAMLENYAAQGGRGQQYAQLNQAYPVAAGLRDAAQGRAVGNAASGGAAVPAIAALVGGALGGIPGALYGAGGAGARSAVGGVAADLGANVARMGSNVAGGVGAGFDATSRTLPPAIQALASRAPGNATQQPPPAASPSGSTPEPQRYGAAQARRLSAILDTEGDPRTTMLSPWTRELSTATDDMRMQAAIEKLMRTDPEFARRIGPLLNDQEM